MQYLQVSLLIGLLFILACSEPQNQEQINATLANTSKDTIATNPTIIEDEEPRIDSSGFQILDSFVIDLGFKTYVNRDNQLLSIHFYKKENQKWEVLQTFDSIHYHTPIEVELEGMDFNFDGIDDLRFFIGTGARGANAYYEVLLWDKNKSQFKWLKSKDMPPNIQPNPKTQLIEAICFYGRIAFETHTIINDSLVQLSSEEVWLAGEWTKRDITKYDLNGRVISEKLDSIQDFGESVFSSYMD